MSFGGGEEGDELGDAGGTAFDVLEQPAEVGKGVMDSFTECDPSFDFFGDGQLHVAEKVFGAWHGQRHGAELAEDLVPLFDARAFLINRDARQDCSEAFDAVRGQGDCHVDCVQDPAEDDLGSVPGAIPLEELLEGDDLLSVGAVVGVEGTQDFVDGVHEEATDAAFVG